MSLTKVKRMLLGEMGVSQKIPITHLVAPNLFETQDGYLGAVLHLKGVPYLVAGMDDLNRFQRTIHHLIQQLGTDFMVMETVHRHYQPTTLEGSFKSDFCKQLHDKYHQRFLSGMYINDMYITLIYKGTIAPSRKGIVNRLISTSSTLKDKAIIEARENRRDAGIKMLNKKIALMLASLKAFGASRLGEEESHTNSLLAFLSLVPNGGRKMSLQSASRYPARAKGTQSLPLIERKYPKGHLGQYLTNHRLFFGDCIQFQGNTDRDIRFGAMLSIKTYGKNTTSQTLDPLLAIDCEYIRTQTYAPIELEDAIKAIEVAHSKKVSANDYATSQIDELGELADLVASEKVGLGFHHSTLMLICDSKEALDCAIHEATISYSKADISIVRETLAQSLSFFAQIPGNARFIARASLITSENFADFCTFHNTQTGNFERCLLGAPITLIQTPQKTPVFFNYHKPGSPDSPSSGHTLMIGGNSAGKTALASFLDAEMNRFEGHRTFFLDRDCGAKIYILACNGTYLTLNPANADECKMNPLQLPDTQENRAFCKSFVEALLLNEGEGSLDSTLTEQIHHVVDYGFDHLAPIDRRLSTIACLFPIDFPRWPELRRWLKASESRASGQYDWAFDNDEDALNLDADKTGIDLTYLMDYVPTHISTPFYMYVMHRIKLSLTGHVTSIIIDEMWQVMKSPYWIKALDHDLPTIRKLFGHIIGLTQSPETVANSPINDVLLNNNASLILFANPKAQDSVYMDTFKITPRELDLIKSHASDSRMALYKQDNESIFCHIDLSAIADELRILSGNVNSVRVMDEVRSEFGESPHLWLTPFLDRSQCL